MKRSALYQRLQKSAFMQKLNSTLLTFHLDCLPTALPPFSRPTVPNSMKQKQEQKEKQKKKRVK